MRRQVLWFVVVVGALAALSTAASAVTVFEDKDAARDMDVGFGIQLWNVASFNAVNSKGEPVDDRWDAYLRRGRFGVKGRMRSDVRYQFTFNYDNAGKNSLSAGPGTAQATGNRDFYLLDAFATVTLDPTWANLTVGYFRPQFGRESITTAFNCNTFIKGLPNSYPRVHLVGRSSGRETGLNLGGLKRAGRLAWNYNVGVFDPNHAGVIGADNGGVRWAPLWAGRLAVSAGDPELERYDLGYSMNFFGRRRGITVAVDGAWQGETNEAGENTDADPALEKYTGGFRSSRSLGVDVLANCRGLTVNAEYDRLARRFSPEFVAANEAITADRYADRVWHVRAGYSFPIPGGQFIEPVVMYTEFLGDPDSAVNPHGLDQALDLGLNWYVDRNRTKVELHYVGQGGRPRSNYSSGKDEKGDFVALGLQLVF